MMKTLEDQLASYAAYHRDPRNIGTHLIGIPLIVAAVLLLLSRPRWDLGGVTVTPALLLAAGSVAYYVALDLAMAAVMAVYIAAWLWVGQWLAAHGTATWLATALATFIIGWALQLVGHAWEGRKPAFLDDVLGLLIGPLFVLAELMFMLGWRTALRDRIEARAGPLRTPRSASG